MNITVTVAAVKGGIFNGDMPREIHDALLEEIITKVDQRMQRPYRGNRLGRQRNTITDETTGGRDAPAGFDEELTLKVNSTLIWPRMKGTSWTRKNIAIIMSMAPRVANKAATRIAAAAEA